MGVEYLVCPLKEMIDENGRNEWFDEVGMPYYEPQAGRDPSLNEVLQVVSNLGRDFTAMSSINVIFSEYQIYVKRGPDGADGHAILQSHGGYHGDEYDPQSFYFYRGWPDVIVLITEKLACLCGDFLVVGPDSAIIVKPGTLPDAEWFEYMGGEDDPGDSEPVKLLESNS